MYLLNGITIGAFSIYYNTIIAELLSYCPACTQLKMADCWWAYLLWNIIYSIVVLALLNAHIITDGWQTDC